MNQHQIYMQRCLELAQNGAGSVSPNPLVGCVIVYNHSIIAEGWHMQYGKAHAEVNAINQLSDKNILKEATLYVNLEPCSHTGKTPPCADLIIQHQVKNVVVGMVDPFEKVAGKGIEKLKSAGINVEVGVLENECKFLNRRFIKFVSAKKPYIILKWAQTFNGYIAPDAIKVSSEVFENQRHITGRVVQRLVHKWRTQEDAIMVATNTALYDNPALDARAWEGKNPIRVILDRTLRLPKTLKIFDQTQPTIIFTEKDEPSLENVTFKKLDFSQDWLNEMLGILYEMNIQSIIIEGGSMFLNTVIEQKIWDEAIVFNSPKMITDGIKAPFIQGIKIQQELIDGVTMNVLLNR